MVTQFYPAQLSSQVFDSCWHIATFKSSPHAKIQVHRVQGSL